MTDSECGQPAPQGSLVRRARDHASVRSEQRLPTPGHTVGEPLEAPIGFRSYQPHGIDAVDRAIERRHARAVAGRQGDDLDAARQIVSGTGVGRRHDLVMADRYEIRDERRPHGGAFARERRRHVPSFEAATARELVDK